MSNEISEITRRNLFDELRLTEFDWAGRLAEDDFLSRVFDLTALRSNDPRCRNMAQDVHRHRVAWGKVDWDHYWVYEDIRLNLLRCDDEVFLRFLCEMAHPIVRSDEDEVKGVVATFNRHLSDDGYEIVPRIYISGSAIFVGRPKLEIAVRTETAHAVADEFASDHIFAQITRMETNIQKDPALAIGTAKEFVETICKGILTRTGYVLTGSENLPKLVKLTREKLNLDLPSKTDDTLTRTLQSLATLTQGIAELRGQLGSGHGHHPEAPTPRPEVARLTVGMAVALGVFLYETFRAISTPQA